MYTVEILNKRGEVIEVRYFHSEYEAEHYGRIYQEFMESIEV